MVIFTEVPNITVITMSERDLVIEEPWAAKHSRDLKQLLKHFVKLWKQKNIRWVTSEWSNIFHI